MSQDRSKFENFPRVKNKYINMINIINIVEMASENDGKWEREW